MMAIMNSQTNFQNPRIRIRGFGFHFPGEPVAISSLPLTADEAKRRPRLGQETTYISSEEFNRPYDTCGPKCFGAKRRGGV